jgi:hypothetical protein
MLDNMDVLIQGPELLQYAISIGKSEIVKCLLEKTVDPDRPPSQLLCTSPVTSEEKSEEYRQTPFVI